jgi:nucleoid DNA-binding protein
MNKAELIAKVAELTSRTQVDVTPVVNTVFEVLKERMYQEEDVNVAGFGRFGIKKREERAGRNPQTGEALTIPAKNAPYFKASKELKEYVQD